MKDEQVKPALPTGDAWVQVQRDIGVLANAAYPLEACGFIVKLTDLEDDPRVYVVAVPNVAEWPYAQFRIDEEVTAHWLGTGRVIGVWHSHPSDPAVPSEPDQEQAVQGIFFLVYAVQDEDMGVFTLGDDGRLYPEVVVMPS